LYDATAVIKGEKTLYKMPTTALYEALGDEGIKDLMYRFYDEIYDSSIAHFFPQDEEEFTKIKEKNALFFLQICGGETVYDTETNTMGVNEYMIRLHDDFSITPKARYEWLGCMETALRDTKNVSQEIKDEFWDYLEKFSKLTVNTFDDGSVYYAAYEAGDIVS